MRSSILSAVLLVSGFIIVTRATAICQKAEPGYSARVSEKYAANSYLDLFERLMALPKTDIQSVAQVENFSFRRDVATFDLLTGQLFLLPPVTDRPAVMVFKGDGEFSFSPPTRVEEEQFQRYFDNKESLREKFDFLFLVFADKSYEEFAEKLTFDSPAKAERIGEIDYCLEFLSDKDGKYFNSSILKAFFDGEDNGLFYAQIHTENYKPLFFMIDPYEVEEVRLMRQAETSHFYKVPEIVNQFHTQEEYASRIDLAKEQKDYIQVEHYNIEAAIAGNLSLDFAANVEMTFRGLMPNQRWVPFVLFYDLEVESAVWADGSNAEFFKGKENPVLWIRCDPPLMNDEKRVLKLQYKGDLLRRDEESGEIYIRSTSLWYPRYGERKASTFDLTYHTPKKYPVFVSVGEQLSSNEENDVITTKWKVGKPANFVSFNLGNYDIFEVKGGKTPPITVMGYKGSRYLKDVAGDIENSMMLFSEIFGEYPVDRFYATATPYLHGVAFPGLIHLSSSTFESKSGAGYSDIFRAHEVAHQWWGIAVDFATYHDQWLSEGFSDFAGLKYMQTVRFNKDGTKKYFNVLKDWRDQIFSNRKFLLGSGQEAGPIWLGYRTSSSSTAGDYGLIIYKKGAWVLHMLRMMLIDVKNLGNEQQFTNMIREFYSTYRGKKPSTDDFKKIVEKYTGMDMDWFFQQWVYGTDIPEYDFAYTTVKSDDGKYMIRGRVKQKEVAPHFKAPVLFYVDFGEQRVFTTRKLVTGEVSEIDIVKAPFKPKKVVFNYLESVLCKVKNEKW